MSHPVIDPEKSTLKFSLHALAGLLIFVVVCVWAAANFYNGVIGRLDHLTNGQQWMKTNIWTRANHIEWSYQFQVDNPSLKVPLPLPHTPLSPQDPNDPK